MTPKPPKRRKHWLKRISLTLLVFALLPVAVVETGLAERWMRGAIVAQLEKLTGGQVALRAFRFDFFGLRAEIDGLTIRGREPENSPPLLRAEHLLVDVRVVSLFGRKIALDEVRLDRPQIHVRFDESGRSNYPGPKTPGPPGKPVRERIFDLTIRELRLNDGELLLNNTRVPLVAEGGELKFALDFNAPAPGQESYRCEFRWQQMRLAARRYLPFASDVEAKFTLARDSFTLTEFRWKLPRSEFKVGAELASFREPAWTFHYQGWLSLDDLRRILRKPHSPRGRVEFLGEGRYAADTIAVKGKYVAREIEMPYEWFHASGIESRGSYQVDNRGVVIPDFRAQVLGGEIAGRVTLEFDGLKWRAETRAQGLDVAAMLHAVDHGNFPVDTLHWGGVAELDSVTTWARDFKQVESRGVMRWSPPVTPREGEIPVTAHLDYDYVVERKFAALRASHISTPTSQIDLEGPLGVKDSALRASIDIGDLLPWNDFINRIRGRDEEPVRISGRARWEGRVLGDISKPTFNGHVRGAEVAYGRLYWDEIEGDITYSPDEFRLESARAVRHGSSATIDVRLEMDDWSFRPESRWSFRTSLERAATDELQELFGTSYPAHGLLTGTFSGQGTRRNPELTGSFDIAEADAWGFHFDRIRGRLDVRRDEIRIADADLRLNGGRIAGNFLYRPDDGETEFAITGTSLAIETIERLQTERLPLAGQLQFQLRGGGPLRSPWSAGTARIVDLRVGKDRFGSFEAALRSDGRRVHVDLSSAMEAGQVAGELDITLGGDYPFQGDVTLRGIDIDPFIENALRLTALTGHSSVEGHFRLSGALRRPETITVEADIAQLKVDYQYLKLENIGPLRFVYRREEVRIEQAHIRGPETDFVITGTAGLTEARALDLDLAGTVNLQLATGLWPDLNARGAAQVNASVQGTFASPRITGRIRVENAAANYGDFPAGLSKVTGEFVFDRTRLVFENVSAEAGGGQMLLGGTVTYGEDGPLRFDLNTRATRVRVRYPEGMSWLSSGTLRLSGTPRGGLLSGRVVIERLLMAEGFDLATLIVASREGPRAPATSSPFLRNLQFDIEATSSPNARVEWSAAQFEAEAALRVRGTWDHPILLGHIRLLNGEMMFRGNRYRLTRGDINFSNPFRLVPVLGIEATTSIRQYEIALNFSGPADKLSLSYRSDPPLPASDIIGLLALGRTSEESELRTATPVQSPELGATTLLSEAISSQIGGRVERLFGISRFKVDPFLAGTGSEQNASARITIEQQLTRDLTVTYITNVTSTQQQVIQVEYNVNREVSLIFLRDQNGTFGVDVKFKKRFR